MLRLLINYLTDRKQFTTVNGTESNVKEITCGVPQGSVLGPLLFLLYSNDIQNCTKEILKLFADDTNGFIFEKDFTTLKQKIKLLLESLFVWSSANKLTINISKTCYSIFRNPGSKIPHDLNSTQILNGTPYKCIIKRETQTKYLGIYLDELLKWEYHIEDSEEGLLSKLTKINNSFKIVKHYIPENIRRIMFNAYFSSKVQYGLEIIGTARKEILHKLQVKQNRALKILFNKDFYTPTKKLHHELKVLMVEDMYKYNMGKFVYKQQIGLLPDIFENHFTTVKATHDHMTRQNDHLQTNTTSLNEHAQKKSNVKAAKIWNQIPKDIRNANTLSIFKEQYKQYLLEHYNTD